MLTFSGWQWAALIAALRLPELNLSVPVGYLLFRPALLALCALGIAIGLFSGNPWAPGAARWGSLGSMIWLLLERALMGHNEYVARSLLMTAIVFLMVWGVFLLALQIPKVRNYYQEQPA